MTIEFTPWPKTPRLFRDAVITEKIDGTNAAVVIRKLAEDEEPGPYCVAEVKDETATFDTYYEVAAQSRKRLITPEDDNFGFAAYVREHAAALVPILREGVHFGEWWGHGIQRGYGLPQGDRRFSLFNVHRYGRAIPTHELDPRPRVPGLGVVPVLDTHTFSTSRVEDAVQHLREQGSYAAPGFLNPEGVVVFHSQSGQVFKALIENDAVSKTVAENLERVA